LILNLNEQGMTMDKEIILPVITLVTWSMMMWVWMYATRIPAMSVAKMKLDPNAARGHQMSTLPPNVRWKADNYTHLMEQPTLFYALAISLAVIGEGSGVNLILAWAYVVLRVIHSLVQATINKIEFRFLLFALSNVPLFALTFNAAKTLLS